MHRSVLMAKNSAGTTASTTAATTCTSSSEIIACCFSQLTSPTEQLLRRHAVALSHRLSRRSLRLQGKDFFVAEDEMSTNRLSGRSRRDDLDGFRTAPRSL